MIYKGEGRKEEETEVNNLNSTTLQSSNKERNHFFLTYIHKIYLLLNFFCMGKQGPRFNIVYISKPKSVNWTTMETLPSRNYFEDYSVL